MVSVSSNRIRSGSRRVPKHTQLRFEFNRNQPRYSHATDPPRNCQSRFILNILALLFSSALHSPIFFIIYTNSSKEISPSPFSSTYLMIASKAALSRCPPNPRTSLISSGEMMPEPSLSNILNAACNLSLEVSSFSFMAATTNSE